MIHICLIGLFCSLVVGCGDSDEVLDIHDGEVSDVSPPDAQPARDSDAPDVAETRVPAGCEFPKDGCPCDPAVHSRCCLSMTLGLACGGTALPQWGYVSDCGCAPDPSCTLAQAPLCASGAEPDPR